MRIGEICNRDVVSTAGDESIRAAAEKMRQYHVGDLVVVANRFPVGILSDRDIVIEVLAQDVPCDAVKVADVMSTDLLVLENDEPLDQGLARMRERGVRRAPVVDAEGALVGIVTLDDLIGLLTEQFENVIGLIRREQRDEQIRRSA